MSGEIPPDDLTLTDYLQRLFDDLARQIPAISPNDKAEIERLIGVAMAHTALVE